MDETHGSGASGTGTSNVLLLAASGASAEAACRDRRGDADPSQRHQLSVTFPDSREDGLGAASGPSGDRPAWTTAVRMGSFVRSTGAGTETPSRSSRDVRHRMETVEDPGDVRQLGIVLSRALERWEAASGTTVPDHAHLCFDSVTALLEHVDERQAFQFLHILTRRVEAAGAVAHYHLDPEACGERTVATLSPLFDDVVEVDGDRASTGDRDGA